MHSLAVMGRPLADTPARLMTPLAAAFAKLWDVRKGEICLVPAPLYHSAPWAEAALIIALNGTAVVMERFDEEAALRAIEKYRVTHAQFRRFAVTRDQRSLAPYPRHDSDRHQPSRV
jgi:acyl-CoA synthetase (AMP-forming)/AMP-acid ligase II